jgi:DNA polymerase
MPDYNKALAVLRDEWESCQSCRLGEFRMASGGHFVFGEGPTNALMVIGEGPGIDEDSVGRPFVGSSGQLLRMVLGRLGVLDQCYLTNVVSCRSCGPDFDLEGNPRMVTRNGVRLQSIKDQPPPPDAVNACLQRLYEEIYLVDPLFIVVAGGTAASTLLHRSVTVTTECGTTHVAKIPGAMVVPSLTKTRRQWRRKVKGDWVMPTLTNDTEYLVMPVTHPAYVQRNAEDRRPNNPFQVFVSTLRKAADIYSKLLLEVHNLELGVPTINDAEMQQMQEGLNA